MALYQGVFQPFGRLAPHEIVVEARDDQHSDGRVRKLQAAWHAYRWLGAGPDVLGSGSARVEYEGDADRAPGFFRRPRPMRIGSIATIGSVTVVTSPNAVLPGLKEGLMRGALADMLPTDTVRYAVAVEDLPERVWAEGVGFAPAPEGVEAPEGMTVFQGEVGTVLDGLAGLVPSVAKLRMGRAHAIAGQPA